MLRVVTTMNRAGWKQTGARMVESFRKHWPADVEFLLYAEDFDPNVSGVTVKALPAWLGEFKARHKDNRAAHGQMPTRYDFRFDAVKFSHKVAAVTDAGLSQDHGVLIWLDADTFTHANVTHEWLASLFPEPSYIAWLDRVNHYPECGFVMYRCSHRSHRMAMEAFRDLYISDQLFRLGQTHDCIALQHLIESMARAGDIEAPVSLSGSGRRASHVLANSPLSSRIDHLKGSRKSVGRTPKSERFLVHDGNPYWS